MNKFPHAKPTKAELGTSKTKLAGYKSGIADNLNLKTNFHLLIAKKKLLVIFSNTYPYKNSNIIIPPIFFGPMYACWSNATKIINTKMLGMR